MATETQTSPHETALAEEPSFPRDALEQQLAAIWREILEVPAVGIRDDFFALGGTSLESALVVKRIQRTFSRELPVNILFETPTVEQLATLLRKDPSTRIPSIIAWRERGSAAPLFCLPGAAGDLVTFRDLWLRLPESHPVYGVDYPSVAKSVEGMAAERLADIVEVQPKGPYYLVGLCFGGLVAFEMARLLASRGQTIAFLGLLDPPLPGLRDRPFTWSRLATFAGKIARSTWQERAQSVHNFTDRTRWKLSARWNAAASRVPLGAGLVNRTSLNVHAVIEYRPAPLGCPLVVFLTEAGGRAYNRYAEQEWAKLASHAELVEVRGNHQDFIHEPHVGKLSAHLVERLQYARRHCRA